MSSSLDVLLDSILDKSIAEFTNAKLSGDEKVGTEVKVFAHHADSIIWNNNKIFYPFGSTPAKCLLLNSPVFISTVRILLLGTLFFAVDIFSE